MTHKTQVSLIIPDIDELCCVNCKINIEDASDSIVKSLYNYQILTCRLIISTVKCCIASPSIQNIRDLIHVIVTRKFYYKGTLQKHLKDLNIQFDTAETVHPTIYKACLKYTFTFKIAPYWNLVGKHYVRGLEYLNEACVIDALQWNIVFKAGIAKLDITPMKMKVQPFTLEFIKINSFRTNPDSFIDSINLELFKCPWVYVLPNLTRAKITSVSKTLPRTCPFENYTELRRYWKNMYSIYLPKTEKGILFYEVVFSRNQNEHLTYPEMCIFAKKPDILLCQNRDEITSEFINCLNKKVRSVCDCLIRIGHGTFDFRMQYALSKSNTNRIFGEHKISFSNSKSPFFKGIVPIHQLMKENYFQDLQQPKNKKRKLASNSQSSEENNYTPFKIPSVEYSTSIKYKSSSGNSKNTKNLILTKRFKTSVENTDERNKQHDHQMIQRLNTRIYQYLFGDEINSNEFTCLADAYEKMYGKEDSSNILKFNVQKNNRNKPQSPNSTITSGLLEQIEKAAEKRESSVCKLQNNEKKSFNEQSPISSFDGYDIFQNINNNNHEKSLSNPNIYKPSPFDFINESLQKLPQNLNGNFRTPSQKNVIINQKQFNQNANQSSSNINLHVQSHSAQFSSFKKPNQAMIETPSTDFETSVQNFSFVNDFHDLQSIKSIMTSESLRNCKSCEFEASKPNSQIFNEPKNTPFIFESRENNDHDHEIDNHSISTASLLTMNFNNDNTTTEKDIEKSDEYKSPDENFDTRYFYEKELADLYIDSASSSSLDEVKESTTEKSPEQLYCSPEQPLDSNKPTSDLCTEEETMSQELNEIVKQSEKFNDDTKDLLNESTAPISMFITDESEIDKQLIDDSSQPVYSIFGSYDTSESKIIRQQGENTDSNLDAEDKNEFHSGYSKTSETTNGDFFSLLSQSSDEE